MPGKEAERRLARMRIVQMTGSGSRVLSGGPSLFRQRGHSNSSVGVYVFGVAQIFNLPYRRFVIGRTLLASSGWQVKNTASLRYGRGELAKHIRCRQHLKHIR